MPKYNGVTDYKLTDLLMGVNYAALCSQVGGVYDEVNDMIDAYFEPPDSAVTALCINAVIDQTDNTPGGVR